jgi:hypothetical protein
MAAATGQGWPSGKVVTVFGFKNTEGLFSGVLNNLLEFFSGGFAKNWPYFEYSFLIRDNLWPEDP